MMSDGMGHPFGHSGSAVLAESLPSLFPTPSWLAVRAEQERALMLCKYCSAITRMLVS